jgi:hypothetical protein
MDCVSVFFDFDGWIIDFDLDLARDITRVLDAKLAELDRVFRESDDPDGGGLCDTMDYTCGMGFVAIQRYLTSTCNHVGLSKTSNSLRFGTVHSGGHSVAVIANATANYWKHCDEWDLAKLTDRQRQTADVIKTVAEIDGYTCMNVLHSISKQTGSQFAQLIEMLETWRDELIADKNGKK